MHNEVADLAHTLGWTANAIAEADTGDRIRIAAAYRDAQCLIASIVPDHDGKRPRVLACLKQVGPLKEANDLAACGWILAAIEERVSEQDLPGWEGLEQIIDKAVKLLQYGAPRLH